MRRDNYFKLFDKKLKTIAGKILFFGGHLRNVSLNKLIPILKTTNEWLGGVNSQSLQGMTSRLNWRSLDFSGRRTDSLNSSQKKSYTIFPCASTLLCRL